MDKRAGAVAAGLVVLVLALAGCSSSTDEEAERGLGDASPSAAAVTAAAAASAAPAPAAASASAAPAAAAATAQSPGQPSGQAEPTAPKPTRCVPFAGAQCDGAQFIGANLAGSDLSGIHLAGANLGGAILSHSNLSGADLTGAILEGANLTGAILTNAQLAQARMGNATFAEADLSTFEASDPIFSASVLCMTKMAGGVINSRNCPCSTSAGGGSSGEPVLGTMSPGALSFMPRNYIAAKSQVLAIDQFPAFYALVGNLYGGDGRTTFGLPTPTGPWAGLRQGPDGTGDCLQWTVPLDGTFPQPEGGITALPGEVLLTSIGPFGQRSLSAAGLTKVGLGYLLGANFSAWQVPQNWPNDTSVLIGSLHLFPSSAPLPAGVVPADGNLVKNLKVGTVDALRALLGDNVPYVQAPDGYVWGVATDGIYPQRG